MADLDTTFATWHAELWRRHSQNLTFPEIRRGLQALSDWYVHKRAQLKDGRAFDGAGKRAAFALFYGPMHFRTVGAVVWAVGAHSAKLASLTDLGCGTGTSGAAWATSLPSPPQVTGIDVNPWALGEARLTYAAFGLQGSVKSLRLERLSLPARPDAGILLAYSANELDDAERTALWAKLDAALAGGSALLVVEPIAKTPVPFWDTWAAAVTARGGRADEWRFPVNLPADWKKLAKAAGLSHGELSCRSLYVPPRPIDKSS